MTNEATRIRGLSELVDLANQSWAAEICFEILDHRILVRTVSAAFADIVRRMLRSFPHAEGASGSPEITFSIVPEQATGAQETWAFYRDGQLIKRTSEYWKLLRILEWQLDLFMTRVETRHLLLHSGSLAINGSGIILPGSSKAGKSSLTMALLLRGFGYFSDELTAISTMSGELAAFPKPLSCRDPSLFPDLLTREEIWFGPRMLDYRTNGHSKSPVWFAHPEDIRQESVSEPVPVSFMIFPQYEAEEPTRLVPMPKAQAMRKLVRHTLNFPTLGESGFRQLATIVENAEAYTLSGSGLPASADLVEQLARSD